MATLEKREHLESREGGAVEVEKEDPAHSLARCIGGFPRARKAAGGALVLLALLFAAPAAAGAETVSVVAHVHTTISDGDYDPEELAAFLTAEGIDFAIITDHDRLEIDWAPPLVRQLVGFPYRRRSIATEGFDRYVRSLREATAKHPGVVLLPGIEANPYYRIEVDWRRLRVRVHNLHEHLLAFGLDAADLAAVPSIANGFRPSVPRRLAAAGAALLPIAAFVACLRRRPDGAAPRRPGTRRRSWALLAGAAGVAALAAVDVIALAGRRVHQFSADAGALPYQLFIDGVRERGGLTFWSHPGVHEVIRRGPVEVVTRPYWAHLAATQGYDGFDGRDAALFRPGGLWDRLLAEHADGKRPKPPWFLAQADFKRGRPAALGSVVNHVEVDERSVPAVLAALRAGRFHTARGRTGRWWRLEEVAVSDGARRARPGETLAADGALTVAASFRRLDPRARPLVVEIIRDGRLLSRQRLADSGVVRIAAPPPDDGETSFFRLNARTAARVEIVANPIFVRRDVLDPRDAAGVQ